MTSIETIKTLPKTAKAFMLWTQRKGEQLDQFLLEFEARPFSQQLGAWAMFLESLNLGVNAYRNGYSIYILDKDKLPEIYRNHFLFEDIQDTKYYVHLSNRELEVKPILSYYEEAVIASLQLAEIL